MDPRCKGMPLSSFLLKPMQRVTRYPLIIKNVRILIIVNEFSARNTPEVCFFHSALFNKIPK